MGLCLSKTSGEAYVSDQEVCAVVPGKGLPAAEEHSASGKGLSSITATVCSVGKAHDEAKGTDEDDSARLPDPSKGEAWRTCLSGPPVPSCNEERLQTLRALGKLEAPPDAELQSILTLVKSIFNCPSALVALFDDQRIFVSAADSTGKINFTRGDIPWRFSFCAWSMASQTNQLMVVPDATKDARFADNHFVIGEPGVRHYCGSPLIASNGHRLGSLCFIDTEPRELDAGKAAILANLTEMVVRHVEKDIMLQMQAKDSEDLNKAYSQLYRAVDCFDHCVVLVDTSVEGWKIMYANSAWDKLTGSDRGLVVGKLVCDVMEADTPASIQSLPSASHQASAQLGKEVVMENVIVKQALLNTSTMESSSKNSSQVQLLSASTNSSNSNNSSKSINKLRSGQSNGRRLVIKMRPASGAGMDDNAIAIGVPSFLMSPASGKDKNPGSLYFMQVMTAEQARKALFASRSVGTSIITGSSTLNMQEDLIEGLELGILLGRGAFGSVYSGNWFGTPVAVKVIDQDVRTLKASGASMEALLGSELRHPNVISTLKFVVKQACEAAAAANPDQPSCTFTNDTALDESKAASDKSAEQPILGPVETSRMTNFDSGFSMGSAMPMFSGAAPLLATSPEEPVSEPVMAQTIIVLEFADRGSLQDAIDRGWLRDCPSDKHGKPDMSSILLTATEIASALNYLHSHGVVHGDLSAFNVLLSSQGAGASGKRGFVAKVADFGLSRSLESAAQIQTKTYGTITHQPPETLSSGIISRATDTFAVGVLMWQMYTGSRPWSGMSTGQIFMAVTGKSKRLVFPPGTPQGYVDICHSCMAFEAEDRPTMSELLVSLKALKGELSK